jgi:ParB family chromosome partitioning protein
VKWLRASPPGVRVSGDDPECHGRGGVPVSDVENRSRKDISDWERAKEYTVALAEFYEGSQSQMAEHLNLSSRG